MMPHAKNIIPERVKEAVKDLLVGKWQYVGLEVEKGNVNAQRANSTSLQTINAPTSPTEASKGATSEQATAPNVPQQPTPPDPLNPEAEAQTPEANATRLPPIEVMDEESNQQILGAKTALVASTRKNLMIEFSEDRSSYYYSGSNRGTNVTGQCSMSPPSDTATIHFHLSVLIGGRDRRCLSSYSVPNP